MANTYAGNVIYVDTSAAFSYAKNVCGIKVLGGSAGSSIDLLAGAVTSGSLLWRGLSSVGVIFEDVEIRDGDGVYVAITGTATALIYLEAD